MQSESKERTRALLFCSHRPAVWLRVLSLLHLLGDPGSHMQHQCASIAGALQGGSTITIITIIMTRAAATLRQTRLDDARLTKHYGPSRPSTVHRQPQRPLIGCSDDVCSILLPKRECTDGKCDCVLEKKTDVSPPLISKACSTGPRRAVTGAVDIGKCWP